MKAPNVKKDKKREMELGRTQLLEGSLLLQRTQVSFLIFYVTSVLGAPTPPSGLYGHLHTHGAHESRQAHINIK